MQSKQQQVLETKLWWWELLSKIGDFDKIVGSAESKERLPEASRNLRDLLIKDGYEHVSMISAYFSDWHGEYDVGRGIL